ncbi:unnamed protein product, partial [Pneumocystis jirovecii]
KDEDDLYEFVCDSSIQKSAIRTFEEVAARCIFERKYRKSHEEATDSDLNKSPMSAFTSSQNPSLIQSPLISDSSKAKSKTDDSVIKTKETEATQAKIIVQVNAELHLFDAADNVFVLQDNDVVATVSEIGLWEYWLEIKGNERIWLGQPICPDINPEHFSFIWNYCDDRSQVYSWLLRFSNVEIEENFQEGFMIALWEMLNQQRWIKMKDEEKEYVIDTFHQDVEMENVNDDDPEENDQDVNSDSNDIPQYFEKNERHYANFDNENKYSDVESDNEDEYSHSELDDKGENSQLAVGYKHDRSFVVRGDKIGVFRHVNDDQLEFVATINKIQTPKGKLFQPSKIMLHNEDSEVILQNPDEPHNLYQMDLEYGKVVDEWKINDDISILNFTPKTKFSQMTAEKTLIGISHNSLFRIDSRLPKDKIVMDEYKQYTTRNDFSVVATTEKGYIAVASNKGDIRLFDRVGINAKTALPALGEPIIGIDVSADGKWILATCTTYLLLIDSTINEGKNQGKLGFEKSFGKDTKPKPKRLQLNPVHVAMMQGQINFTPAKFNTGKDIEEKTIVTSSGPYVISWELSRVIKGETYKYKIRQYPDEVKANNFKFGTDKNVIVALPHNGKLYLLHICNLIILVSMINKSAFRKPTRESLLRTPTRNLRSRSNIVNSPY